MKAWGIAVLERVVFDVADVFVRLMSLVTGAQYPLMLTSVFY